MINAGILAVLTLSLVHLFANQSKLSGWIWHGRFLSCAAGISFAYVFVDLLPALEKGQYTLKRTFGELVPYFDRHAYVIALLGVLFYYGIHVQCRANTRSGFGLAILGYVLFNFFVGASLSDSANPEIQPLTLYTIALGMHYFVRDHNIAGDFPDLYVHQGRWLLVLALMAGYFVGYYFHIPDAVVAIVVSFLAGGVLLNVLRYELPKREQVGYLFFLTGTVVYTIILLSVGEA